MEPGLEAVNYYDPPNFTFPYGAYICVADIDVDTGETKIRRFYALDAGRGRGLRAGRPQDPCESKEDCRASARGRRKRSGVRCRSLPGERPAR
jgi:hypothetical protein